MKILSLNITEFGALRDLRVELSEPFTIIRGDNESGKSTILLFVTYLLYGLNKRSSKNSPSAYDKDRSLSWSSMRAEGSMEIEHEGKRYRIERTNIRRTSSSEATVTDLGSSERVFVGEEPGEVFFGVSKETFESCLWCGQTRTANINGEKVSSTLSNLSLTADESVDGEKVLSLLREAKKQYRHERGEGGLLGEISERLTEIKMRAAELEAELRLGAEQSERFMALAEAKSAAEARCVMADEKRKALSAVKLIDRFAALRELKENLRAEREMLTALESENTLGNLNPDAEELAVIRQTLRLLGQRKREYNASLDIDIELPNADTEAIALADAIAVKEDRDSFIARISSAYRGARALSVTSLVLGAVGLLAIPAYWILPMLGARIAAIGGAGLLLVTALVLFIISLKRKNRAQRELKALGLGRNDYKERVEYSFACKCEYDSEKETVLRAKANARQSLDFAVAEATKKLSEYGREPRGDLEAALEELINDILAYLKQHGDLERSVFLKERFAERDEKLLGAYDERELIASVPTGLDRSELVSEGVAEAECESARAELKRIEAELSALGIKIDRAERVREELEALGAEREKLEAELSECSEKYAVLDRAYRAVEEAYTDMRNNFAPAVRASAGELIARISGGKYSDVFLSGEFEVGVELSGKERAVGMLSTGTYDAVYIALRLALIKNVFKTEVPFFMDESLSMLDDKRASAVLEVISKFVDEGNQCVLFSCHNRECDLCDTLGVRYNKIEL